MPVLNFFLRLLLADTNDVPFLSSVLIFDLMTFDLDIINLIQRPICRYMKSIFDK